MSRYNEQKRGWEYPRRDDQDGEDYRYSGQQNRGQRRFDDYGDGRQDNPENQQWGRSRARRTGAEGDMIESRYGNDRSGWTGSQGSMGSMGSAGMMGRFGSHGFGNQEGQFAGRGPRNYKRGDARIQEDINERLTQHGHIDATDIEVTVQNGEVTLKGHVDNRQAKRMAEELVEGISGVKDVTNQIKVQQQRKAG
jgi:osmotically-inducible protein OsmY